jgi:hypothetical protein
MSLEHAPSRRGGNELTIADDLLIGAEALAAFVYGDPTQTRDIYRNVLGLPLFHHGAKLAGTKSGITETIRAREKAARELVAAGRAGVKSPPIPQRQTSRKIKNEREPRPRNSRS